MTLMYNKNFDKLIGTWATSGVVVDGGEYDGTEINGTDTYTWLGDSFVVHTADVLFGDVKQQTVEMFQLTDDGFVMTAYNSDGSVEKMKGRFDNEGVYRAGDDTIRTTLRIAADGTQMSAIWETNQNGDWTEWMTMSFKKLK